MIMMLVETDDHFKRFRLSLRFHYNTLQPFLVLTPAQA